MGAPGRAHGRPFNEVSPEELIGLLSSAGSWRCCFITVTAQATGPACGMEPGGCRARARMRAAPALPSPPRRGAPLGPGRGPCSWATGSRREDRPALLLCSILSGDIYSSGSQTSSSGTLLPTPPGALTCGQSWGCWRAWRTTQRLVPQRPSVPIRTDADPSACPEGSGNCTSIFPVSGQR